MKNIIKYIIIFMLVSIPIAFAIDFSPSGDIDGLERYGIKNFTSANATAFYQNGNKVLDDTSNVTATSIDWANVTNKPTNLSNFTDDLGDRGYSVLSNFTDDLGNRGYTVLSNFTDDLGDRGYSVLSNFTDDLDYTDKDVNTSVYFGEAGNKIKTWWAKWFYRNGETLYFNETQLNSSIDDRVTSSHNNYTTEIDYTGTSTKTLNLARNGMENLTASFTDIDTTYSAGNGIDLSTTTFSVAGNTGIIQDSDGISLDVAYTTTRYVNRSLWTSIDNYPSGCTAGNYVRVIGDSLTCDADEDTTYDNSTPIGLSGNTFSLIACPNAQGYFYNTTLSDWECRTSTGGGGGTVTQVDTDDNYLTGGPITSSGTVTFNDTKLNTTIDLRDTNETTRVNNLANTLCGSTNKVSAFNSDLSANCSADTDTTYSAGNGMALATTTFSVAGNTCLDQDADGLSVTADCISDTQLEFNTGQPLTQASNVAHNGLNITNNINMTNTNITNVNSIVFASGGQLLSGT